MLPSAFMRFIACLGMFFIFKLEEEGNTALLLLLPKDLAKDCILESAKGKRCCLVVATSQASAKNQHRRAFVALSYLLSPIESGFRLDLPTSEVPPPLLKDARAGSTCN
jgi:hypothetical protein